jgi:hypothetical protein
MPRPDSVYADNRTEQLDETRTLDAGEEGHDDAEASLILKFERRVEPPDDVREEMERWEDMRRYVHTDAMLLDEEDAVGTNFILRHQHIVTGNVRPTAPAPRINPRKWLPPMSGEVSTDSAPASYPTERLLYAKTHEILLEFQQEQGGLAEVVNGAIQDAQTLPVAWIKMRLQEDFTLDPVGYGRNNDQVDLIMRFKRLSMDFEEGLFSESDPPYAELRYLSDTIKAYVLTDMQARINDMQEPAAGPDGGVMLGPDGEPVMLGAEDLTARMNELTEDPEALLESNDLPEVPYYVGYTWQQVDPEDVRWDWNVRRPEDLRYCRWMAHRAWMTEADVREKWSVTEEAFKGAVRVSQNDSRVTVRSTDDEDPEYGGKDPEERGNTTGNTDDEGRRGDTLAVWEYWDRVQGRVFRWVQGTGKFLDSFVPTALPGRFFPFFFVGFNRVTGKVFGPSDTDLQQPLQDESNRMRTWQREAQKSAHPRWMVAKGLLRPSEKSKFEQALPYSLTEVERAEDFAKSVFPIVPPIYNPALYDRTPTLLEMQQMAGIPAAALGAGNAGMTATSDAIANQQMGNQTNERKELVKRVYADIYRAMCEINAQVLPMENVVAIVGPGAVWPELDRMSILSGFIVETEAVVDDVQERGNELKAWVDFATLATQFGLPLDPIPLTKKLLELMGIRDNIGRYISVPSLLSTMGMPQMQPGNAGASAPDPTAAPDAQGAMGGAGGAPPGRGFSEPPTPDSVPGSPA